MTLWPWNRMPKTLQDGLRAADHAALEALCTWLHAQTRDRRTENEDADLAQNVCAELRRMMVSRAGRRTLRRVESVPAFLEKVARRLSRAAERSKARRETAARRFVGARHIPDPAESSEAEEVVDLIVRAISRLNSLPRKVLRLYFGGAKPREIAASIWGKRAGRAGAHRVSVILDRARTQLRTVLRAADPANSKQLSKTRRA